VAAGLDSAVLGESEILGQVRTAWQVAWREGGVRSTLDLLFRQALRVGKRAHAETGIDRAGQSVVTAALDVATTHLGGAPLAGRSAVVVGAGAMGSLAVAALERRGARPLTVANRSLDRAQRLAAWYGATAVPLADLDAQLSTVDIAVFAAAAETGVLSREAVAAALRQRPGLPQQRPDLPPDPGLPQHPGPSGPLVILDLAIPRNVDPAAADLPGVVLIDIEQIGAQLSEQPAAGDVAAADHIVADEVEAFLTWLRGTDVAPAVAALRARAEEVVAVELRRLAHRRPDLSEDQRGEIAHTVRRVVQRLLHSPTVRVRELAAGPDGERYADLLRTLFDLEVPREVRPEDVPDLGEARL
ncbi:MAG TPA: glutamyl-tRNA reductase, partial [Micromonosporaceae bacterium]|nr:glutamyl-tRNA reductase [Micromonosporaceae bacterium]